MTDQIVLNEENVEEFEQAVKEATETGKEYVRFQGQNMPTEIATYFVTVILPKVKAITEDPEGEGGFEIKANSVFPKKLDTVH